MTTPDRTAQLTPLDQTEVISALVRASFVTTAVLSKIAAEHDLSLTQLRVLAILRSGQGAMSELALYLGLDRSTISGLVDRAEKKGLLRRTPNPVDGRGVDVALTEQGRDLAERGAEEIAQAMSPMTSVLTRAEARRIVALLEQMFGPQRSTGDHRQLPA
jgi:DNA-binding MarR family transcriptional regulator